MSIFTTVDPSDIDAVNEQLKQEAEEREAARREEEQEHLAELARRAAKSKSTEEQDAQPEIESGLRSIFG
ncbi:MAG: hypothetical protein DI628_02405 [Blastochloris viridis]|uniref:Uncharacterized protein n=1 Tax=Blastochloris viridis TaxID=1079 RepID=A0A6N4R3A7_BLAVI|nr:MAG: hypothetical protein DI628_02405 [Blastochloris viridis]